MTLTYLQHSATQVGGHKRHTNAYPAVNQDWKRPNHRYFYWSHFTWIWSHLHMVYWINDMKGHFCYVYWIYWPVILFAGNLESPSKFVVLGGTLHFHLWVLFKKSVLGLVQLYLQPHCYQLSISTSTACWQKVIFSVGDNIYIKPHTQ